VPTGVRLDTSTAHGGHGAGAVSMTRVEGEDGTPVRDALYEPPVLLLRSIEPRWRPFDRYGPNTAT
jgi:hypothetical protein